MREKKQVEKVRAEAAALACPKCGLVRFVPRQWLAKLEPQCSSCWRQRGELVPLDEGREE